MRRPALTVLAAFILAALGESHAVAGELGIDLYGLSYHYEGTSCWGCADGHETYRQVNPGVGMRLALFENRRHAIAAIGGAYSDSMWYTSYYAGFGYRLKLVPGERSYLAVGLDGGYFNSKTWDHPWVAAPVMTIRYKAVAVNTMWLPTSEPAVAWSATLFFGGNKGS